MSDRVALQWDGHPTKPSRRGIIPAITPDGGLGIGEYVVIDDAKLTSLNRPLGAEGQQAFADFLAGVYNGNYPYKKWVVIHVPQTAEHPVSLEPTALLTNASDTQTDSGDPEQVQSEEANEVESTVVETGDDGGSQSLLGRFLNPAKEESNQ